MKILELNILEFGGLSNQTISLSEGLNILEGENEAGKSTVWLFIKFMLYGIPRKNHEDRDRSVSWRTHSARGSMLVRYQGEEYRIERSFTESDRNGSERSAIVHHATGKQVFSGKDAGEVFLGVPKEVFESSCGIGQQKLGDLGGKKGADAIRNLLSAADETIDISHIESKLDKIRVQYRHKNGKGGRLLELNEQRNETKKRWERALEVEKNVVLLEEKMKRTQTMAAQTAEKLSFVNDRLTQLGKLEILRRFDRLRAMEQKQAELDRAIEALRAREQKTERALCEADAAHLRSLANNLRAANGRVQLQQEQAQRREAHRSYDNTEAELGERLEAEGGADAVLAKLAKSAVKCKAGIALGTTLVGLAGIGLGVGFAVPSLGNWGVRGLLFGGIAAGIGLLVMGLLARKESLALAKRYGKTPNTLAEYVERCTEALQCRRAELQAKTECEAARNAAEEIVRETAEALRTALLRSLPAVNHVSAEAADEEAARISAFLSEYGELRTAKAALIQSIQNEREGLSAYDENALRESISVSQSELEGVNPVSLETERRFLRTQAESLEDRFRAIQIELISAKANAENPIELADRFQAMEETCARAEEYYATLELAMSALTGAAETMSGNITPALGRRAGEMMAYISDGRYTTLTAGSDYMPTLLDKEQLTVTADQLSGGTRDTAYLALRISLVMQLFDKELPPLMLDDALCQMDDRRIQKVLSLLGRLCEEHFQCLLFTCHQREARLCEEMAIEHRKIVL